MKPRILAFTYVLMLPACSGAPPAQSPVAEPHDAAAHSDHGNSSNTTGTASADPSFRTDREDSNRADPGRDDAVAEAAPKRRTAKTINTANAAQQPESTDSAKNSARLTPMDQGGSEAETEITATIRQRIMKDESLSFTAKNAKVITVGNKVTLEGLVKNETEKARIEALARLTEGVTTVDNHLLIDK